MKKQNEECEKDFHKYINEHIQDIQKIEVYLPQSILLVLEVESNDFAKKYCFCTRRNTRR